MIDLHSHILPGIDDGSKSPEMSRNLLRLLQQQGVQTVVATPHFYPVEDTPDNFLRRRAEAYDRLQPMVEDAPRILLGAEVTYFDGMRHSHAMEYLQLGQSGLLLVEMPFGPWTQRMVKELAQIPLATGLIPVIAHVNRYRRPDQLPKYQKELLLQGVLFQCNAEAFVSVWQRSWALKMLQKEQIHFLGSDAHNLTNRSPKLKQAAEVITRQLGAEAMDRLTAISKEFFKL